MAYNPITFTKNLFGVVEGLATGDAGKTLWSTVKLGKSCVPFADFIPGLDEVLEEVLETAFEPVCDIASGIDPSDIGEEMSQNAYDFYRAMHGMNGIDQMIDSDHDGVPDIQGIVHTASVAVSYPESLFDID